MAITFSVPPRSLYFYPLAANCKFAERLRPEQSAKGVARKNKHGETVYERYHDAIGGRIVDFSILPPSEKVPSPQYQIVVSDPDDPQTQGYISFGQNTSLGRQLINQLLALTPEMLSGTIAFVLRSGASGGETDGREKEQKGVYLNLYQGRNIRYEYRVPRRFTRDEIPPPVKLEDAGNWDFTEANNFFARHAEKLAAEWKTLLPQLRGETADVQDEDEYDPVISDAGTFETSDYVSLASGIQPDDTVPF